MRLLLPHPQPLADLGDETDHCAESTPFRNRNVNPQLQQSFREGIGEMPPACDVLALERADVAVFLDPPLLVMCARLLRRTLPEILFRKELWNRNRQTWRGAFNGRSSLFGYALQRHGDLRRRVPRLREEPRLDHLEWVRLAGRRDVRV